MQLDSPFSRGQWICNFLVLAALQLARRAYTTYTGRSAWEFVLIIVVVLVLLVWARMHVESRSLKW